jgi:methylthioribose-1-phosphate isomerase
MTHLHDQCALWSGANDALELLDQRLLPDLLAYQRLTTAAQVAQAIRDMVVRGAPAIGITAAYGVVLAAQRALCESTEQWQTLIAEDLALLAAARPTAVNLSSGPCGEWKVIATAWRGDPVARLLAEARGDSRRGYCRQPADGRIGRGAAATNAALC